MLMNSFMHPLNIEPLKVSTHFDRLSNIIIVSPNNIVESKKAFTLAETLITLAILGVVAAISIPSLMKASLDKANRTKIRKAMSTYEKLMSEIVVENQISDTNTLINAINDCSKYKAYFKSVENGDDDCTFKTSDGLWWSVKQADGAEEAIAIVAFKKDSLLGHPLCGDLATCFNFGRNTDEPAFLFAAKFDNNVFRTNEKGALDDNNFERLYNYVNNKLKLNYNKPHNTWFGYGDVAVYNNDDPPYVGYNNYNPPYNNGNYNDPVIDNNNNDSGCPAYQHYECKYISGYYQCGCWND